MEVLSLNRTLDQELHALTRGASLECLACGEFVMRTPRGIACPECGSQLALSEASGLEVHTEAG
jgi:Zn finger protein HypA/HybF involved in hydrogenase expression